MMMTSSCRPGPLCSRLSLLEANPTISQPTSPSDCSTDARRSGLSSTSSTLSFFCCFPNCDIHIPQTGRRAIPATTKKPPNQNDVGTAAAFWQFRQRVRKITAKRFQIQLGICRANISVCCFIKHLARIRRDRGRAGHRICTSLAVEARQLPGRCDKCHYRHLPQTKNFFRDRLTNPCMNTLHRRRFLMPC